MCRSAQEDPDRRWDRMFLDAQTLVESIRAIVLPRGGCLSYRKETHEWKGKEG